MKKKLIRIVLLIIIAGVLGYQFRSQGRVLGTRVEAVGNLVFKYLGVEIDGDPIFTLDDFKPGDCVERTVEVENNDQDDAIVGVYSDNEIDSDALAFVLTIEVTEGINTVYGPESLDTFASDSDVLNEIELSNLPGGNQTSYDFEVCFDEDAGNQYQGQSLSFDLKFGEILVPLDLPEECDLLEGLIFEKIEGTPGNDNIDGTIANELILGNGGNDRIDGEGGHDCIITLEGNDRIRGGSGNDIIVAGDGNNRVRGGSGEDVIISGAGNDRINAGTGDDVVTSGPGNDRVEGSSGDDFLASDEGNDRVRGGSGNDTIFAGTGNDRAWGGSGDDTINMEAGNDRANGNSGDDTLDGGAGHDVLDVDSGTDTCTTGEVLTSCEL